MSFTDRFLKVPIRTRAIVNENLYGKSQDEYIERYEKINPIEISGYKPSMDYKNAVSLFLTDGRNFVIFLTEEEFERQLNEWEKKQVTVWQKKINN